ncbi:MAG: hypothetical protein IT342_03265 [Candidatus Melainabacteria bacterium]|nr:hypothetical protein [Candidatus Melainabacteria bacterium]
MRYQLDSTIFSVSPKTLCSFSLIAQALPIAAEASDSSYELRTLKQLADVEEALGKHSEAKHHLKLMVSDKVLANRTLTNRFVKADLVKDAVGV